MRFWFAVASLSCSLFTLLGACKSRPEQPEAPRALADPLDSPREDEATPSPASSAVVEFKRALQASKLVIPPRRAHRPVLAFGKATFARLGDESLLVYDASDFHLLASEPLVAPRALLTLADGSFLAIGGKTMLHWEREKKRAAALPTPVLLPGSELYPDAQQLDLFWVYDPGSAAGGLPATLSSFRVARESHAVALPEQTLSLASPGGVLGTSREGVWLYLTPGHAERFGPSGLRLSGLSLADAALPAWVLPARRTDQSIWLDEAGGAARVLVSPRFKSLATRTFPGRAFAADVGDEGRLLAIVAVTGEGPRFELLLFDGELELLTRSALGQDAPTGADDWLKVVTQNQSVVVAPREPRVAVGGPGRVAIFDAQGKRLFSIPSQ